MNTVELCRTAGYPVRHRNADYVLVYRLIASGLLPDRRPAHNRHQGSSGAHGWLPVDALVLRVMSDLDGSSRISRSADSVARQIVRRSLADAVRRWPTAPFLVGQQAVWLPAETAAGAVGLVQGVFEGHAWVVPLAAIAAGLAAEELTA